MGARSIGLAVYPPARSGRGSYAASGSSVACSNIPLRCTITLYSHKFGTVRSPANSEYRPSKTPVSLSHNGNVISTLASAFSDCISTDVPALPFTALLRYGEGCGWGVHMKTLSVIKDTRPLRIAICIDSLDICFQTSRYFDYWL